MTDLLAARYEKDPSVVYREIAGEAILVPIRRNVADMESIYQLNEVGAFIWGLVDGQKTGAQICAELPEEFNVSAEQAASDTAEFLGQLLAIGALKAVES